MNKKYIVELSLEERDYLENIIKGNNAAVYKNRKARMLLKMDQGKSGYAWADEKAAEAFDCQITCRLTVSLLRLYSLISTTIRLYRVCRSLVFLSVSAAQR